MDPVIEQTRSVTRQLFAAALFDFRGPEEPVKAFAVWRAQAARLGDWGLVRILDRLDVETFEATWLELGALLRVRGRARVLDWLLQREGSS